MAWYKISNEGDNTLVTLSDAGACCGDAGTLQTCVIEDHDADADGVASITIDGTVYTFTTSADTALEVAAGIDAAMAEAGYLDTESYGTLVSGAADALYIAVTSTATLLRITTVGSVNVAFTCA